MSATGLTAMQKGLQRCEHCGLLSRPGPGENEGHCPRCGGHLVFRKPQSLERTLAFLIAAAICYIPANVLPIIAEIQKSGVKTLWAIAEALNARGIPTPRGRKWEAMSVKNALARA